MIVIAVAVTWATWGALTAVGFGGTVDVATGIVAGAASGAAGAAAGEAVGSLEGIAHFSWKGVAAGAITGAITGGLGAASGLGTVGQALKDSEYLKAAGLALANAGANYVGQKLAGVDVAFSWKSIAASAVGNLAGSYAAQNLPTMWSNNFTKSFTAGIVGGMVSQATRKALGVKGPTNYLTIVADAFGNALGSVIGDEMPSLTTQAQIQESEAEQSDTGAVGTGINPFAPLPTNKFNTLDWLLSDVAPASTDNGSNAVASTSVGGYTGYLNSTHFNGGIDAQGTYTSSPTHKFDVTTQEFKDNEVTGSSDQLAVDAKWMSTAKNQMVWGQARDPQSIVAAQEIYNVADTLIKINGTLQYDTQKIEDLNDAVNAMIEKNGFPTESAPAENGASQNQITNLPAVSVSISSVRMQESDSGATGGVVPITITNASSLEYSNLINNQFTSGLWAGTNLGESATSNISAIRWTSTPAVASHQGIQISYNSNYSLENLGNYGSNGAAYAKLGLLYFAKTEAQVILASAWGAQKGRMTKVATAESLEEAMKAFKNPTGKTVLALEKAAGKYGHAIKGLGFIGVAATTVEEGSYVLDTYKNHPDKVWGAAASSALNVGEDVAFTTAGAELGAGVGVALSPFLSPLAIPVFAAIGGGFGHWFADYYVKPAVRYDLTLVPQNE